MEELPEVEEAIKRDERDLWTAVLYLGETVDEYDLELDAFLPRFRRNEDWKAAVNAIRKCVDLYDVECCALIYVLGAVPAKRSALS